MRNEGDDTCRDDRPDRRSFVGMIVAAVASILAPGARSEPAEQVGSVEELKGQAFAEKDSVRRELERAAPLFVRDQIGTGVESRLTMRLGRDTTLKLGEQARLTIDRYLVDAGGARHAFLERAEQQRVRRVRGTRPCRRLGRGSPRDRARRPRDRHSPAGLPTHPSGPLG